jgi:hypothetical protein
MKQEIYRITREILSQQIEQKTYSDVSFIRGVGQYSDQVVGILILNPSNYHEESGVIKNSPPNKSSLPLVNFFNAFFMDVIDQQWANSEYVLDFKGGRYDFDCCYLSLGASLKYINFEELKHKFPDLRDQIKALMKSNKKGNKLADKNTKHRPALEY